MKKKKIGTVINEEVMRLAKRQAAQEGRSLSDLIQEAIVSYLSVGSREISEREEAYRLFCEHPLQLNPEQFRSVLEQDVWAE